MSPPLLPEYVPSGVDLLTERSNLNGLVIAGVAYGRRASWIHFDSHGLTALVGIVFTLFAQCVTLIVSGSRRWNSKWVLYYAITLFVAATIGFAGNTLFVQMTYVDYRDILGGPNAFTMGYYAHPVNMVANCAWVALFGSC
jgi:H+/Cl- antiporter ClcA